jgi:three-Cys-motif partner protein
MSWEMKPHTKAKHIVLENYLKAWFPIMSFTFERIIYIDGFAGPGKYSSGEDGSPIMALKIAKKIYDDFPKKLANKDIVFIFIEQDAKSYESLQDEINKLTLPKEFRIITANGVFEEAMLKIFGSLKTNLAPTFAFIDPFGTKGVPFEIVKKIMSYKNCEIFFNHMSFGVMRSTKVTDHTELYGTEKWKELDDLPSSEKHDALTGLYASQLKEEAKVKYVRSFNIRNRRNATIFDLIYATNNETGLDKMKIAMWKADPLGNFTFRDKTNPYQIVLFEEEPDLTPLKHMLLHQFKGNTITIEKIEDFVLKETPYLSTHIKRKTLLPMEKESRISAIRPGKSGYPAGTKITFH